LTAAEIAEVQAVADSYKTPIYVVGSRAAGRGRSIANPELPVGKDTPGGLRTRSDIDFRTDANHPDIGGLNAELSRVSRGAGNASLKHTITDRSSGRVGPAYRPYMRFSPNSPSGRVGTPLDAFKEIPPALVPGAFEGERKCR
jgi:hypothetical protein